MRVNYVVATAAFVALACYASTALSQNVIDYTHYIPYLYYDQFLNTTAAPLYEFGGGGTVTTVSAYNFGTINNLPLPVREGAIYGSAPDGDLIYIAGGVVVNSTGRFPQSDIWLADVPDDEYELCNVTLPFNAPVYFGVGGFDTASMSLYLHAGRTDSGPLSTTPAYFNGLVRIDWSVPTRSDRAPLVSSISLTGASIFGHQFASSAIINSVMYVLGGMIGGGSSTAPQHFYSINISPSSPSYGTATTLTMGSNAPTNTWITPVMFTTYSGQFLYVYSGMTSQYSFVDQNVYIYSIVSGQWQQKAAPFMSQYSTVMSLPNFAFAATAYTANLDYMFVIGGWDSTTSSASTTVTLIDLTELTVIPTTLTATQIPEVIFAQTSFSLPIGIMNGIAAVAEVGEDLFAFAGAQYSSIGASAVPTRYVYGTYESEPAALLGEDSYYQPYSFYSNAINESVHNEFVLNTLPSYEGSVYGYPVPNVDVTSNPTANLQYIYFAGGAQMRSSGTFPVNSNVYVIDAIADTIVSVSSAGPAVYFGVGGWSQEQSALYVHSGRTNNQNAGSSNSYNNLLYKITFPSPTSAVVTTITPSPSVQGKQFSSSLIMNQQMYVFGGLTGLSGSSLPTNLAEQFYSIQLSTGQVTYLRMTGTYAPTSTWVTPLLFTTTSFTNIYVYSGMQSDQVTFISPYSVYIYDVVNNRWMPPTAPAISHFTHQVKQLPNLARFGSAVTPDGKNVIVVGGNGGSAANGPNPAGSNTQIVHIDTSPLIAAPLTGLPVITILPRTLAVPTEKPIVAFVGALNFVELFVFHGAQYTTSLSATPSAPVYGAFEFEPPPPAASTYTSVLPFWSPVVNETAVNEFTNIPVGAREGAVWGGINEDVWFAGGAQILSNPGDTFQAYTDIYEIDALNDVIEKCDGVLPSPSYFGTGGFDPAQSTLFIYSGRTNTQQSGYGNTYYPNMMVLDFSTQPVHLACHVTVSVATLSPTVDARSYASSVIVKSTMYVFGGLNGDAAFEQIPGQQWFSIVLARSASNFASTKTLSMLPASNYPSQCWVTCSLFVDPTSNYILQWGGGMWDKETLMDGFSVYVYSIGSDTWLSPITPVVSSFTYPFASQQLATSMHAAVTQSTTLNDVLLVGGSFGTEGPNPPGSHDRVVHIDLRGMSKVGTGSVVVTTMPWELLADTESCIASFIEGDTELLVAYGAHYANSERSYASSYVSTNAVFEVAGPFIQSVSSDRFAAYTSVLDITSEFSGAAGVPAPREGTVYGGTAFSQFVYFAGGVQISGNNIDPFRNIYVLDEVNDKFTEVASTLPGPSYFGTGGYDTATKSLYIYSGRVNGGPTGLANAYFSDMYRVDWTNTNAAQTSVAVSTVLLNPSVQPRQYASSVIVNGFMYVYGGLTGSTGVTQPIPTQTFFSIQLSTGTTSNIPVSSPTAAECQVNPTMFTDPNNEYIYFYSGLQNFITESDGSLEWKWCDPYEIPIYRIGYGWSNLELVPVSSSMSAISGLLPNILFSSKVVSGDRNHIVLIGGNEGMTGPFPAGSHNKMFHLDISALATAPTTGTVTISVLPQRLPAAIQSSTVGIATSADDIFIWPGGTYASATIIGNAVPTSYSGSVVWEIEPSSSSSSSSGLSGGAIAGIVIGVIVGVCLLVLLCIFVVLPLYRRSAGSTTENRSHVSENPPNNTEFAQHEDSQTIN